MPVKISQMFPNLQQPCLNQEDDQNSLPGQSFVTVLNCIPHVTLLIVIFCLGQKQILECIRSM